MYELTNSGLPLYYIEETGMIALSGELSFDGYSRKYASQMEGLFYTKKTLSSTEAIYDVYRGIRFPKDKALLDDFELRYDITVIYDGTIDGERKKTSGHYHGYNPARTATYAEVYEVIKGKALYILQRADNFSDTTAEIQVNDLKFAIVNEGEAIIIPPNYGHCSINIGSGPLIFSNLAYIPCSVHYAQVQRYHGMNYYIFNDKENEFNAIPNRLYHSNPNYEIVTVKEAPNLGIKFGVPIYKSFQENPKAFSYLGDPAPYESLILENLTGVQKK